MINKNNIMLLNDIIHKIYNIEDFDEMRASILEGLHFLIPFDCAAFFLASKDNPYKLANPMGYAAPQWSLQAYLNQYQDFDYTRWTFSAPIGKAYRETDLLSDEERKNHPYYKSMFMSINMHYSIILTIIKNGKFLGTVNLLRSKGNTDFNDEELFFFELLESHLASRLSLELTESETLTSFPEKNELITKYHLTIRELEITHYLLEGIPREEICDKLSISPNTVKKHIANIYLKLNVNSWQEMFQLLKK